MVLLRLAHKLVLKKEGQSLIEVLIALGVALLVIVSLVSVTTVSVRNADFSKKKTQAAKYAQEGLEKTRAYRDQNSWTLFTTNCQNLVSPLGIISGTPATGFTRNIVCVSQTDGNGNIIQETVTVIVSWTDSKGIHSSQLISYFTNWNK